MGITLTVYAHEYNWLLNRAALVKGAVRTLTSMGPNELVRLGYIASRHYRDGVTRTEIGRELGLSRFKVGRLLDKARQMGVVKLEIATQGHIDVELSLQVRQRFGLKRALAVITPDIDGAILRASLASASAALLEEILEPGDVVGLAAGRTLNAVASEITSLPKIESVGLGGVAVPVMDHGVEVIRQFAQKSSGPNWPIFAPLLLESPEVASSLRHDPLISQAHARFSQVTKGLVAIGSWDPPDSQLYDTARKLGVADELVSRGVVGEVLATLYDREGTLIPALADRSIAMTADGLRQVPEVIAIAGGPRKTAAVLGAIRAKIVNSLVVDTNLARRLLKESSEQSIASSD